eukprot:NODE_2291_length_1240_cov_14.347607_g2087_i0.p1 GENE.NODE_2291_length_1240_cov_14.347607_g2087_i0~~NODE_2291_length_1240_cov_14.347607_g2087_i0.p1  ORF type:complete len:326 (+),score=31.76 NODE_2291_length_1240_cov_14.347607_g2087_i0:156-1133(+)
MEPSPPRSASRDAFRHDRWLGRASNSVSSAGVEWKAASPSLHSPRSSNGFHYNFTPPPRSMLPAAAAAAERKSSPVSNHAAPSSPRLLKDTLPRTPSPHEIRRRGSGQGNLSCTLAFFAERDSPSDAVRTPRMERSPQCTRNVVSTGPGPVFAQASRRASVASSNGVEWHVRVPSPRSSISTASRSVPLRTLRGARKPRAPKGEASDWAALHCRSPASRRDSLSSQSSMSSVPGSGLDSLQCLPSESVDQSVDRRDVDHSVPSPECPGTSATERLTFVEDAQTLPPPPTPDAPCNVAGFDLASFMREVKESARQRRLDEMRLNSP